MFTIDGKRKVFRRGLAAGIAALLLGAGYMMGTAAGMYIKNRQEEIRNRPLKEQYGISPDMADGERKDQTNRALSEGMKAVYIEPEIYFARADAAGDARISNGAGSSLCVKCTIIRDATGEIVYDSKIIDPGKHIKDITLLRKLEKGFYPCTVVWTFYSQDGEVLLGETACNVVVIIEDG